MKQNYLSLRKHNILQYLSDIHENNITGEILHRVQAGVHCKCNVVSMPFDKPRFYMEQNYLSLRKHILQCLSENNITEEILHGVQAGIHCKCNVVSLLLDKPRFYMEQNYLSRLRKHILQCLSKNSITKEILHRVMAAKLLRVQCSIYVICQRF